jgi:hypothetical protein
VSTPPLDAATNPPRSPDPIVVELTNVRGEIKALRSSLRRSRGWTAFSVLLAAVVGGIGLAVYRDDEADDDREAAADAREAVTREEQLRLGCENAVAADARGKFRAEAFARGLGELSGTDVQVVESFIVDLEDEVDAAIPPRDCAAEARARMGEQP